ncbi:trypsin-like peptidase domain-containing protein [Solitalea lacus]|uniref:trypsin-like peptidase domain-containing protein n=1 Tax=Solitalea lacus TaxID=2911172 RepID=UPI001EDA8717|nr:trypsin-like peptidase domain-containing protein [Solitalea lacus]UKJ07673.1 trypsin-like peptidase domain-containing protein [Solitalea lacus]
MKKLLAFLICLQIFKPTFAQNNSFNSEQMQAEVKQGIKQAYNASVRIIAYNTESQKGVGGHFSGVVVDRKGHILTAGHAITPNAIYLVTFTDGRQVRAKGLGVINSNSVDAAMLVITDKGKWPSANMGWSSILENNVPCLSIACPSSLGFNNPTVRFGYIYNKLHENGYIQSTCLMEPGDSGGPLFDLNGRVIGIHSRIRDAQADNFETPIDVFRKYWTALQFPEIHTAFIPEDKFSPDKKAELKPVPEMVELISSFKTQDSEFQKTVFAVKDSVLKASILSTLVNLKGLVSESDLKGKSFFISKSSEISEHPLIEVVSGKFVSAKVISRDEKNDLVLLGVSMEIKGGVDLQPINADSVSFPEFGNFLISPRPQKDGIMSVLGNRFLAIPKSPAAFLGVGVNFNIDTQQIVVTALYSEGTNVKAANVKEGENDIEIGDVLTSINNEPILTVDGLSKELSKYDINQSVSLQYTKKSGSAHTKDIVLKHYYVAPNSSFDHFIEGKSQRRDNFKEALVHDGKLKPADCGGPLYGTNGKFYGINIARFSRTTSLAIPAKVIVQFVKESKIIL